jgi:hypothetical protein
MILRCEVLPIPAGQVFVLNLLPERRDVPLVRSFLFLSRRTRFNSARASVVADIPGVVHDHRFVIDISHVGDAHIRN